MAKLYFRYSTMNAGKSLDLLKVAYNYEERNQNILLFTSGLDDRHGIGKISSRIGITRDAKLFHKDINIFQEVKEHIENEGNISCILIDEAQFLSKENVKQLANIVDELNIPVICYGLRSDFRGELFEGSYNLFALADNIEEIKTICHCGKKATMVLRMKDGLPIYEGEQIQIGGNKSYVAVCRKHYKNGKI